MHLKQYTKSQHKKCTKEYMGSSMYIIFVKNIKSEHVQLAVSSDASEGWTIAEVFSSPKQALHMCASDFLLNISVLQSVNYGSKTLFPFHLLKKLVMDP